MKIGHIIKKLAMRLSLSGDDGRGAVRSEKAHKLNCTDEKVAAAVFA